MVNAISGSLSWPMVFIALLAIFAVFVIVLRSSVRRRGGATANRQQPKLRTRLSVIETLEVDEQRRLMIVQCDDEQHLLLIGAQGDIVVRQGLAVQAVADEDSIAEAVFFDEPAVSEPVQNQNHAIQDHANQDYVPQGYRKPEYREEPAAPEPQATQTLTFEMPRPATPVAAPRPLSVSEPIAVDRRAAPEPRVEDAAPAASMLEPNVTPPLTASPRPLTHTPPEFSEMTRKLEEALKRTASHRTAAPRPIDPRMAEPTLRTADFKAPESNIPDIRPGELRRADMRAEPVVQKVTESDLAEMRPAPVERTEFRHSDVAKPDFEKPAYDKPEIEKLGELSRNEPRVSAALPESLLRQTVPDRPVPSFTTADFTRVSVSDEPLLQSAPVRPEPVVAEETEHAPVPPDALAAAPPQAQPAASDETKKSADPFEEEIRRLLGRDRGTV